MKAATRGILKRRAKVKFRSFCNSWVTRRFVGESSGFKILPGRGFRGFSPPPRRPPERRGARPKAPEPTRNRQICPTRVRAFLICRPFLLNPPAGARNRPTPRNPPRGGFHGVGFFWGVFILGGGGFLRQIFQPRKFSNETPRIPRIAKRFKNHFHSPFSKYLASLFSFQSLGAICFRPSQNV